MKNKRVVIAAAVFLCAAFFFPTSRIASVFCYPFIVVQSYVVDPIKRHITGQRTSYQELQDSRDELVQQHIRLQASADFVRDARDVIAFQERYDAANYCIAQVLERHIGDDAQYVLLDKGLRAGVKPDAAVVYKDMLVGKITDVYPFYARCMLITDRQCKVGGYVAGSDVSGIMQGTGDGMLQLLHVSHLQHVKTGDLVISSGHGLIFPRGFGIAQTVSVEPDGLTLKIVCTPLIDFGQLTYCSILMR